MTGKPQLTYVPNQNHDLLETQRSRDAFKMICVGTIVSSTLYQVMVFVTAALWGMRPVMLIAIATAGVTYLSFIAQLSVPRWPLRAIQVLVGGSILLGMTAGIVLLALYVAR